MTKEMIFRISPPLQEKIRQEYAELLSKATGIDNDKILQHIEFEKHGFLLDIGKIDGTPTQKEKLKHLATLNQKSRLLRSRDFSIEKSEDNKSFRFERENLEQIKQVKKDKGIQR